MNLSDVVRASKDSDVLELTSPPEKTDFMKVQPAQVLTEKARTTPEYERGMDNLIRGLVDLLPKPGSDWSLDDRAKWFRLAVGIFDLGYKTGDVKDREIHIALVGKKSDTPNNGQLT
jgi:hypothetical protein